MLLVSLLPDLAGVLVVACFAAPACRGESLLGALKRVDDEDFTGRITGNLAAGAGTTLNIREIMIGRCWDYQRVTGMLPGRPPSVVDCGNTAWPAFVGAFANRDPCTTPKDAFSAFINIMTVNLPRDGTIFWSGTKNLATMYSKLSGGTMFSLELSFLGYTVNGLTWCGELFNWINYDSCPSIDDPGCPSLVSAVFWASVSKAFASQARGSVSVLLDGSDQRGAFRNNSFFGNVELPNLNTATVDLVKIMVVHKLDGPIVDTCNSGTILILKDRISKRGLRWQCEDDPKLAKLIQCTENPDFERCNRASAVRSRRWKSAVLAFVASFLMRWTGH